MAPGGPPGGHRWNFTFRVDRVARGGAAVGGGSGSTDCRRGASNSQPGCAPILAPSSCMYSVILKEIHDDDDDDSVSDICRYHLLCFMTIIEVKVMSGHQVKKVKQKIFVI